MIVVGIIGILTMMALPSFSSFLATQKVKIAASAIQSSLYLTRAEVSVRNSSATMSPNIPGQWTSGWSISAQSIMILTNGPMYDVNITGPEKITYQRFGRLLPNTLNVPFEVSSAETPYRACIIISMSGIPRIMNSKC
jgi:type IV fimbrial biogenesis protein FimT